MWNWFYPVLMLAAIVTCSLLLRRTQQRLPLTTLEKFGLGIGAFCGAMIAAKLPFLLGNIDSLFSESSLFIDGKTIMLGIVGGYLGVEFAKWTLQIKTRTGDSFAVPVAVAVAIGRLACFSAACCHGQSTELPWGVHFSAIDDDPTVLRHPTQIYEFIFHLVAAGLLLISYCRLYRTESASRLETTYLQGNLIKIYILAYLVYRFASEFVRPEPVYEIGLTFYQVTALVLIPVFVALWICDVAFRPMAVEAVNSSGNRGL